MNCCIHQFIAAIALALAASQSLASNASPPLSIDATLTPVAALFDAEEGWAERRPGKFLDSSEGVFAHAELDATLRIHDTLSFESTLSAHSVSFGEALGFTELFAHWRPVPTGQIKHRLKAGIFYPPISLENSEAGWQSPFTKSFSAINTWVAEEIRVSGLETSHQVPVNFFDYRTRLTLSYAPFVGNDPAGALLAWKGWSVDQRQSVYGEKLPLLSLPLFENGEVFEEQEAVTRPFKEVDGRIGHYVGFDWTLNDRMLIRALYYDNRAKPTRIKKGQYGWKTEFTSLGFTTAWRSYDLVVQAIRGTAQMGPKVTTRYAVDNQFSSAFFLVSREFTSNRLSFRHEWFDVKDRDATALDPNTEDGYSSTLSYQRKLSSTLSIHGETVAIRSKRPAWLLFGRNARQREVRMSLGFTLSLNR